MIGIPLANWLVDRADFNHRFLGETLWDISIYFFGLAWLIYAVTLPAIKNWHLVGCWRMDGECIIAPDGHKRNLGDFRGAVVESNWLRHPTIRLVGDRASDVEISTGFRSGERVDTVLLTLNDAIAQLRNR